VIVSYVEWIGPGHTQVQRFGELVRTGGNHPHRIFDQIYKSMNVLQFGRLGKFDFLALIGRLGLEPISPGSAYLEGATGPLRGTRLLFTGDPDTQTDEATLENWLQDLDERLNVGMQVMEDSLCNWQKSPSRFVHFRG
jgi:hypothetical protein